MGTAVTATVRHIPAGETWSVIATAVVTGCEDFDFTVQGSWGCAGAICQTGPQLFETADVDLPQTLVIADLARRVRRERLRRGLPVRPVAERQLRGSPATSRSAWPCPAGLNYVDNSTRMSIQHAVGTARHGGHAFRRAMTQSQRLGTDLVWSLDRHLSEDLLSPEDELLIHLRPHRFRPPIPGARSRPPATMWTSATARPM